MMLLSGSIGEEESMTKRSDDVLRGPLAAHAKRRPTLFLYSEADIARLMAAARDLRSPLRSVTLETLIGLLAVTGLRVGEAIRLNREDVDLEGGS